METKLCSLIQFRTYDPNFFSFRSIETEQFASRTEGQCEFVGDTKIRSLRTVKDFYMKWKTNVSVLWPAVKNYSFLVPITNRNSSDF